MADEISEPLSDNQALNQMVAELEELNARLANKYDTVKGDANFILVTSSTPYIKAARPFAVKSTISNRGPNQAEVRENGVLVALVAANTTKELPLAGSGSIRISVASGQTANVAMATYNYEG